MGRVRRLLPGILVAATGVGAGDLITASLAGSAVGLGALWAVWLGALFKLSLNEGLARWQMATGTTLLQGWAQHLGRWLQWAFLVYLLLWTVVVGAALMNACGVGASGLLPLGDPAKSKVVWGIVHGLLGLVIVRWGSFALFERAMSFFAGLMFVAVVATALSLRPDWGAVGRGLTAPRLEMESIPWIIGLVGGVGGTVTLLSYGYWIREHGRDGRQGMRASRLDLSVAYAATAVFGLAMVIIGSRIQLDGKGAGVALALARQLEISLGAPGKWLFLVGFWGAVFSSLLGVWQGVPYLFADFDSLRRGRPLEATQVPKTRAYRGFQVVLVFAPMVFLGFDVRAIQLAYAVFGALFMPFLAATLLWMNNRSVLVGRLRNGWVSNAGLLATLGFFAAAGGRVLWDLWSPG